MILGYWLNDFPAKFMIILRDLLKSPKTTQFGCITCLYPNDRKYPQICFYYRVQVNKVNPSHLQLLRGCRQTHIRTYIQFRMPLFEEGKS